MKVIINTDRGVITVGDAEVSLDFIEALAKPDPNVLLRLYKDIGVTCVQSFRVTDKEIAELASR